MRLKEAIELYNTKNRILNMLKRIREYRSELGTRGPLARKYTVSLLELYEELFKEIDYENILQQKINTIDVLLDGRYEGV